MHPNAKLIDDFYGAFSRKDPDAMAACYHPEATFSDPAFPDLSRDEVCSMWRMFCESDSLTVTHRDVTADDDRGSAVWEARYDFSTTGRPVHNVISARFDFEDGLIRRHVDDFPFWRWTRQALGPVGLALGWTPLVKKKVRAEGAKALSRFRRSRGGA